MVKRKPIINGKTKTELFNKLRFLLVDYFFRDLVDPLERQNNLLRVYNKEICLALRRKFPLRKERPS